MQIDAVRQGASAKDQLTGLEMKVRGDHSVEET